MPGALCLLDVVDEHLDVSVPAKTALHGHFEDLAYFGTAQESPLNGLVLVAQPRERWYDADCLVLGFFMPYKRAIGRDSICRG